MTAHRPAPYTSIKDYAIIGDCRAAALVSSQGSIDWLCWPRFDSPAIFCALLDADRGGSFQMSPRGIVRTHRRYVGATAVLRTTFQTAGGEFVLTDCMTISSEEDRRGQLIPEHEILRTLSCTRGEGEIDLSFDPRTGFAQWNDKLTDRGEFGIRVETREGLMTLRADVPVTVTPDRRGATASSFLRAGHAIHVSLTWTADAPAVLPPLGDWTRKVTARTLALWEQWSGKTTYDGPYREAVLRSAIVVRLLTYAPSGATIAAATSSLPEKRGGSNNWDYRFCWLRDAALTVRGMLALGHPAEARAFTQWMLHSTRLTQPVLRVLYDVYGRTPPKESRLPGLSGHQNASPVQTGNGADDQTQLDSYGEVIDSVWRVAKAGSALDRVASRALDSFGKHVCKHWRDADSGIWEPRGRPERHTHSLLLCWTALDRLVRLQDMGLVSSRHRSLYQSNMAQIRCDLDELGYSCEIGAYVSILGGKELDATALLIGWYGYDDPASERMRSTFRCLVAQLGPAPGLIYRNKNAGDDGAFGVCCFWLAEHLAQGGGTLAQAQASFEATLSFANDVGLFAEEIEPGTGAALGNMPQTFTHVGLINAALSIAQREQAEAGAK